ncbi:Na+ dependent nucleoside transporter C-terminus-domain-containing protein [Diplogelasinospora grovesii]|uniref:Na+ dependent nucleoside transporter C-terminus-domain-containing protein n=1 Tax=Diplogelasinospora grovesii TaxID=303347 RepID=A0AAN6N227_9PEZI|nr:Na+ dependent nucleoside transporter C-terminus-domain-containing protein [Diplogelasinospora grovesii]
MSGRKQDIMSGSREETIAELSTAPMADDENKHDERPKTELEDPEEISNPRRRWSLSVIFLHFLVWLVMTGWWIAGLILHRYDLGWLIPFLVWLGISIRLLTLHLLPTTIMTAPIAHFWAKNITPAVNGISRSTRLTILAVLTLAVVLAGTFATGESVNNRRTDRAVSVFGLLVFLGAFWATSKARTKINWQAVITGILMQFLLGLFVLRTQAGYDIFNFLGFLAKSLLSYAGDGTAFLTSPSTLNSGWFLVTVIPPMIFFVSFIHLLYYWGWIQWLVSKFAAIFFHLMGISGAEAVVAAASPFLGQGESAVLIKAYLPSLTRAELHQVMTSGFATIAGSVLSAYIALGVSPTALISSCVMSIPASIALSKLRYPETEEPVTRESGGESFIGKPQEGENNKKEGEAERPFNSLHALARGSWAGIKIAGMVVASVLCILAVLGLVNGLLGWWGRYLNIADLNVQLIVGYVFYPIAFLLGVERNNQGGGGDLLPVAQLIGIKIVANEFVAYADLTQSPTYASLSPRSRLIAMYALCGFGNISAVGIQIGALSQLAPKRAAAVAEVAVSALVSGIFSTLTSASIAGMLMVD